MRQQKTVNVDTTLPERGRPGRPGREGREGREGPEGKVRLERRVADTEAAT